MAKGSAIYKFDIFKRVPKDLTEPTFCGALCIILLLLINSFSDNNMLCISSPS